MTAYYNEFDPYAAQWLRNLIDAGHIAPGVVDTRSICDVKPSDLDGFTQCHFFAGIGGWSLALRLAGWPDERPVWTGSCPCQAFSAAGKQKGFADERHLWPTFAKLIAECRPPAVFGEQVEAAIRHGWLDLVATDLEAQGYAFGSAILGAHSVDSPHRRQRLYWAGKQNTLADTNGQQIDATNKSRLHAEQNGRVGVEAGCATCSMAYASREGSPQQRREWDESTRPAETSAVGGFWHDSYWIRCKDGKARQVPTEPSLFPLAYGIPNRVGLLRGAGNAIVPQVAAEFIQACL